MHCFCALFHHLSNIFSLRQFLSKHTHTRCRQAREILSSFHPCNETNDCLPARRCGGRLWTRQVQLRLKLLCLNLSGQNGDFRKVASRGKCKWASRKCRRQFVHVGCVCVCVWNQSWCVWPEPRMKIAQRLWHNSLINWAFNNLVCYLHTPWTLM